MSHIAVYRTTLGNVNIDILKKALEVLALEETSLEIRDYIEDWYGKKHTSWEGNKIIGAIFNFVRTLTTTRLLRPGRIRRGNGVEEWLKEWES